MSKQLTITIPEYVAKRTIDKNPGKNRSEWIAELLLLGMEAKEKVTPEFFSLVNDSHIGVEA